MNITLRGTSGSGKSHLVRQIMSLYPSAKAHYKDGRKIPIAYTLQAPHVGANLAVIGSYENACGGCDTIKTYDEVFGLVREFSTLGYNVLFEGVLLYCETQRTIELSKEYPLKVIALNTPLDECVRCVNERRTARGNTEPVNPKNTESKYKSTLGYIVKLKAAGLDCEWLDRISAFNTITKLLNINTTPDDYKTTVHRVSLQARGDEAVQGGSAVQSRTIQPRPDSGQLSLL